MTMAMLEYTCVKCDWWGTGNVVIKRCPMCHSNVRIDSDDTGDDIVLDDDMEDADDEEA
jgi:Zn finger protein HypA/HybF involved in hydrogenase expression